MAKKKKEVKRVRRVVKFPKFSVREMVEVVQKVRDKYGSDIIPYSEFAKSILGLKSPKGGTYQIKIEALKLYGLMDRHSFSEIAILPEGKDILDAKTEEDKKKLMFERVLSVPIIKAVYDKYGTNFPQKLKPITDTLTTEGMESGKATRLATVILKDYSDFAPFISLYLSGRLKSTSKASDSSLKQSPMVFDEELCQIVRLIGSIFPLEQDSDVKSNLELLAELSKRRNLKVFYGLVEGLKSSVDTPERIKEMSGKIVEIFEEDSGIKITTDKKQKISKEDKLGE